MSHRRLLRKEELSTFAPVKGNNKETEDEEMENRMFCYQCQETAGNKGCCRFQYQVQRYDKSNASTSFGDLKSKLFLGLLFSSILIYRIYLSSMSLKEVPLGMYCRMSLLSNSTWGLSVEQ